MEPRIRITDRALKALRDEGIEPQSRVLVVRHVLGCGGSGFRLTFAPEAPRDEGEGRSVASGGGLRIWLDHYSYARLEGAAIDYDTDKETGGFRLDHPDAACAAFC